MNPDELPEHPALKHRYTLDGHTKTIYRMAISPDGSTLAVPSQDSQVRLWDTRNGRDLKKLVNEGAVICVGWSPDGKYLAAGTNAHDGITIWDKTTGQQQRDIRGTTSNTTYRAEWSPDGEILAWSSMNGPVFLLESAGGEERALKGHSGAAHGLTW